MEVGVEVWIKDYQGDQSWLEAIVHHKEVTEDNKQQIVIRNSYGEDFKFIVGDDALEIEDVKLRNAESEAEVENLISLPYLHEPAILYCLEQRYASGDIYTYTGPILIAMNPFKRVPLYTNEILEVYYNSGLLKSQGIDGGAPLPPHVYAIADSAYREMMKSNLDKHVPPASVKGSPSKGMIQQSSTNHSILISGESGAGKTESTKIVLKYLTTVGNPTGGLDLVEGSVMDKVLQSNPILEAFGNARTLRNDNSSRFGKFIELSFNKRGHLIGGSIKTYLLEKVRLPNQQLGERNFHIFYQVARGATDTERARWELKPVEEFFYAAQGGIFTLRDIDDLDTYKELKHSLKTLNFSEQDQTALFDIVAGLLHLGEVEFKETFDKEGEGSMPSDEAASQTSLEATARLLGIPLADLVTVLTVRNIVTRDETYAKKMTPVQASDARDAFAKAIYGRTFDWLVYSINKSIEIESKQIRSTIGVLDIFGFECFIHNSFEQLCINYTNETLQQQFNQYIFKMEQIEYQREKIEWSFIEFPDNQDCLDLIEHKVNGILAMLDDECRLPQATDEKLANRMYKSLEKHDRFSATAAQKRDKQFAVKHYAGLVVYSTITFVDKNKDELPKEASTLIQKAEVPLLAELFTSFGPQGRIVSDGSAISSGVAAAAAAVASPQGGAAGTGKTPPSRSAAGGNTKKEQQLQSVGSQFKGQLNLLMEKIYSTTPHYIRCLKPNDQNVPDNYNRIRITEQLRYGGVLEAVRVARSGFPVRLSHTEFYSRYRLLANPFITSTAQLPIFLPANMSLEQIKVLCDMLLHSVWDQTVPEVEDLKATSSPRAAAAPARPGMNRRKSRIEDISIWKDKHTIASESIQMGLTKVFLRKPAHDVLESRRSRRLLNAVRRIQSTYRRHSVRWWYTAVLESVRLIQRVSRGMLARSRARNIRNNYCAKRVQTQFRRYKCQIHYRRFRKAVLTLQSRVRGIRASRFAQVVRENIQATRLTRLVRGFVARWRFRTFIWAVVKLQNRVRKAAARKIFKEKKAAAKDIGNLTQNNEALKLEIENLKRRSAEEAQRIKVEMERQIQLKAKAEQAEEVEKMKESMTSVTDMLEIEKKLRQQAENDLIAVQRKLEETEQELQFVKQSLHVTQDELSAANEALAKMDNALAVETARADINASVNGSHRPPVTPAASSHSSQPANRSRAGSSKNVSEDFGLSTKTTTTRTPSFHDANSLLTTISSHTPSTPPAQSTSEKAIRRHHEQRRGSRSRGSGSFDALGASLDAVRDGDAAAGVLHTDALLAEEQEQTRLLADALSREAAAREQLEEEVVRLRAQVHEAKSQPVHRRGPAPPLAASSSTPTTNQQALLNKSKAQSRVPYKGPDPHAYSSADRTASRTNIAAVTALQNSAARRNSMRSNLMGSNPSGASAAAAATQSEKRQSAAAAVFAQAEGSESKKAWENNWDGDEDDSASETGSQASSSIKGGKTPPSIGSTSRDEPVNGISAGSAAAAVAHTSAPYKGEAVAVLNTYEKNLEAFRQKMKNGLKVFLWEGQRVSNQEVMMKLDETGKIIVFEAVKARGFSLWNKAVDVPSLGLREISECIPGAEVGSHVSDQNVLMTMVTKASHESPDGGARILAMQLSDRDARNATLTGFRTLMADLQINASLHQSRTVNKFVAKGTEAKALLRSPAKEVPKIGEGNAVSMSSANPLKRPSLLRDEANPMMSAHRLPSRRLSVREQVLEETASNQRRPSAGPSTAGGANSSGGTVGGGSAASTAYSDEMRNQLAVERSIVENMKIQMMLLSNDLNERDSQIRSMKHKEEQYEQTLTDRENMFKQDAMVRMQLGKRLEQILMDKEEAMEQMELLKDQVDNLKATLAARASMGT